ncbi:MAG: MoxR family ATPase [Gemmatimonadetes bacterium]|nr:MoxR family ATPase [Gemmatimonadota bacterium]
MESSTIQEVEGRIGHLTGRVDALRAEIAKRVVGQEQAVEEVLLCLLTGGHGLLEGVPGLAKTMLVRTLSDALHLEFRRVQFTPDLMPGDITGTEVIEEDRTTGRRATRFLPGPVFTQVLLADEINRAPPKTQAALLEAMQEGHVTTGGEVLDLPRPFFVLATQNPIEQEGTYPLPEAQLDRFMLKISLDYPDSRDEIEVLRSTTGSAPADVEAVLTGAEVLELQELVRGIAISDALLEYTALLVRSSRPGRAESLEMTNRWVRWGAGPRAGQALILCAKAWALVQGRLHVAPEDLARVAPAVLRHRILVNFQAEAEGRTPDEVVATLLSEVAAPRSGLD